MKEKLEKEKLLWPPNLREYKNKKANDIQRCAGVGEIILTT